MCWGKSSYVKVRNTVHIIQLVQLCEFQEPFSYFAIIGEHHTTPAVCISLSTTFDVSPFILLEFFMLDCSAGADIRSVCTEAGMYAIRARRKTVTEKDFLDAVNKVIKGYQKFSATPKYMVYN
jgi:SpoVK/Ycf46/Vps4 family AAA+-type ATPase